MPYSVRLKNLKNDYDRLTYNTHMGNPSVTCLTEMLVRHREGLRMRSNYIYEIIIFNKW